MLRSDGDSQSEEQAQLRLSPAVQAMQVKSPKVSRGHTLAQDLPGDLVSPASHISMRLSCLRASPPSQFWLCLGQQDMGAWGLVSRGGQSTPATPSLCPQSR
ncbi:hypothetical protein NDU88_002178 [Pleurodeles waltl]|uniref:Uncharacterized protein n=1 Tax=Pleurodeles waltl TaxID=8319 RepID=A0AAV7NLA0_PLEWA|nr:hypothetical protein NDU88_002178 [Pleurodeles waltl]